MAQADQDNSPRVLVIHGHETVFSAGNDVAVFLNQLQEWHRIYFKLQNKHTSHLAS
jgi:enoyl-CoA hydratase/carnithine racemase